MIDLTNPIFTDADKAREHLEAIRWPNGPICPHCGNCDQDRITKHERQVHRPGLYKCNDCRKQFTVTVGTVFERSKIPLNKWLLATHLMPRPRRACAPPATPHARRHLQDRLVHGPPHPRSHEGGRCLVWPAWRRRQDRGSRRDLLSASAKTPAKLSRSRKGQAYQGARPAVPKAHRGRSGRARRQGPHVPCPERHQGHCPRYPGAQRRPRSQPLHRRKPPLHRTGKEFAAHRTVKHSAKRICPL